MLAKRKVLKGQGKVYLVLKRIFTNSKVMIITLLKENHNYQKLLRKQRVSLKETLNQKIPIAK